MLEQISVKYIDHVTMIVKSLDASQKFYVDLLGMQIVDRPAFDFPGAWYQAGATLVHLIEEHEGSGPAGLPGKDRPKSARNHHFAFEVEDATAVAEFLNARGIEIFAGPKLRPDGAVQVFLTDPDGHVIELCTSSDSGS